MAAAAALAVSGLGGKGGGASFSDVVLGGRDDAANMAATGVVSMGGRVVAILAYSGAAAGAATAGLWRPSRSYAPDRLRAAALTLIGSGARLRPKSLAKRPPPEPGVCERSCSLERNGRVLSAHNVTDSVGRASWGRGTLGVGGLTTLLLCGLWL